MRVRLMHCYLSCRSTQVIISHSSSISEQSQGQEGRSEEQPSVGPPVTTRIPLSPLYTFSPALLQADPF